jgi:GH24 family phage-related lysozyme (muramidase)
MSDMLKRQMQALESMMYSDDDTTTSTTEGLMGQGMSDSEPEDYVTSFVKYLRSKRDLDPAKAREEIPAVKARNTSITDEDIAKYEEEMNVFEQAKQSAMQARLQREASGITQSLTEEDVAVRAAVGDPEYGNKLDKDQTIMIDVTDTDEGKLSNAEPLYELGEDVSTTDIDVSKLDTVVRRDTPAGKGLMSPSTEEAPEIDTNSQENTTPKRISDRAYVLPEVPDNIDTVFLGQQEGAAKTKAYVPKKNGKPLDSSGVTIGTGVDLGSKDKNYFRYLDDADLVAKLEPYFGKKKDAAVNTLKETPLTLTAEEVKKLDAYVKKMEFRTLKNKWNQNSSVKWEDLPSGKATAVASVYYQYGPAMFKHNFWKQTTGGQWQQAYSNLMSYGDKYSSRRKREAAVLKKAL